MSIGSIVLMPWPISGFLAVMVTIPSGAMRMKALGTRLAGGGPCGACPKTFGSMYAERSKPPPAIALTRRKARRPIVLEIVAVAISASLLPARRAAAADHLRGALRLIRCERRCLVNCLANADVGSAATDVSVHRRVDVLIGRFRRFGEQRCSRHHLPGLAVAALRYVKLRPRSLHGVRTVRRKPLGGCGPGTRRC